VAKGKQRWWGYFDPELESTIFNSSIRPAWNVVLPAAPGANPPKGGDPSARGGKPENVEFDPTVYLFVNTGGKTINGPDSSTPRSLTLTSELIAISGVSPCTSRTNSGWHFETSGKGDYSKQPESNTAAESRPTLQESSKLTAADGSAG